MMLKGLSITTATKDCRIFDYVEKEVNQIPQCSCSTIDPCCSAFQLKLGSARCQERPKLLGSMKPDEIAKAVTTVSYNEQLGGVLREGGDMILKSNVDSMSGEKFNLRLGEVMSV